MPFGKLLMSETALGCGIWSLVWNISLWSMISFFVFGSLFLIFATISEVKQTFHRCPAEINILSLVVRRPFKQRIGAICPYGTFVAEAERWVLCRIVLTYPMSCCFALLEVGQSWVGVVWSLWSCYFGSETSFLGHRTTFGFSNT